MKKNAKQKHESPKKLEIERQAWLRKEAARVSIALQGVLSSMAVPADIACYSLAHAMAVAGGQAIRSAPNPIESAEEMMTALGVVKEHLKAAAELPPTPAEHAATPFSEIECSTVLH